MKTCYHCQKPQDDDELREWWSKKFCNECWTYCDVEDCGAGYPKAFEECPECKQKRLFGF